VVDEDDGEGGAQRTGPIRLEDDLRSKPGCMALWWRWGWLLGFDDDDDDDDGLPPGCWTLWLLWTSRIVAAVVVAGGIWFAVAYDDYGNGTETHYTVVYVPETHVVAPATEPIAPIVGGSLCIVGQGSTSLIDAKIVTATSVNETWTGSMQMFSGGQPVATIHGSGPIVGGEGTIPFTITSFGTYGEFEVTDPSGRPVPIGGMATLFPFQVVSDSQPCVQAGGTTPLPLSPSSSSPSSSSSSSSTTKVAVRRAVTTTTTSPPYSLLAVPGSLMLGLGILVLGGAAASGVRPRREPEPEPEHEPPPTDQVM